MDDMARSNAPEPPAPLTREQVKEWLDYENEPIVEQRDNIIIPSLRNALALHPRIEDGDEETAQKFTDDIETARSLSGKTTSIAKRKHDEHKRPIREMGTAVDGWYQAFDAVLVAALTPVQAVLFDFMQRKRAIEEKRLADIAKAQREAAEAAAKAAKEAEEAAGLFSDEAMDRERLAQAQAEIAARAEREAAARPAETSRVRGIMGAVASIRQTWKWRVVDIKKVPRAYLMVDPDKISEARKMRDETGKPLPIQGIEWVAEQTLPGMKR